MHAHLREDLEEIQEVPEEDQEKLIDIQGGSDANLEENDNSFTSPNISQKKLINLDSADQI